MSGKESNYVLWAFRLPPEMLEFLKQKQNISEYIREAILLKKRMEEPLTKEQKTIQLNNEIAELTKKIGNIKKTNEYRRSRHILNLYNELNLKVKEFTKDAKGQRPLAFFTRGEDPLLDAQTPVQPYKITAYYGTYDTDGDTVSFERYGIRLKKGEKQSVLNMTLKDPENLNVHQIEVQIPIDRALITKLGYGDAIHKLRGRSLYDIFDSAIFQLNKFAEVMLEYLTEFKNNFEAENQIAVQEKVMQAYEAEIEKFENKVDALRQEILKL
jgi:hypothetical protein